VVLVNVGDVRLIDVERGMGKCRIAVNIRCNEQIALSKLFQNVH
jgi:hypothetical protein